jgi:hypothetical protein
VPGREGLTGLSCPWRCARLGKNRRRGLGPKVAGGRVAEGCRIGAYLMAATTGSDGGRWSLSTWRRPGRRKKPGGMLRRRPRLGNWARGRVEEEDGREATDHSAGGTARRRPVSRGHVEESRGTRGFTRWRGAEQRQKRNSLLVAASRG